NEYYLALKLDPNFVYSHYQLFYLYSKSGQNEKAVEFKEFIETIQSGGNVSYQEIEKARNHDSGIN
ncbi:MAG: tetratricopeptide repeat protein, partial [Candidatus Scalindua sp.]